MDIEKQNKLRLIDRIVGYFSPSAGVRRLANRHAMDFMVSRGYDGASRGRRTKGWKAPSSDGQSEVAAGAATLRNRARDTYRNSAYGKKGMNGIVTNTIGAGIISKILDNEKLNEKWQAWCDSTFCDFENELNFYGLQNLAFKTVVESGEVLVRRIRETNSELGNIRLQILEPDFLDTRKITTDGKIFDGIQFDDNGNVEGYWIFKRHPGSRAIWPKGNPLESFFVPATEMRLCFLKERPGQKRGASWAAPVLMALRDYDDYEDAQLVRQKIAACFVGFLKDTEHSLNQIQPGTTSTPLSEKFQPGMWEHLPPGKEITFGTPPGVGNDYEPYTRRKLQSIAAGLGISYEELTGDLSQVNFSSGRMGWLAFQRNIDVWRWNFFIPSFCKPAMDWWLDAESVGSTQNVRKQKVLWTPPRREMIDPVKETEAMKNSVRSGFSTLSDSVRQLGYEPKEHFQELSEDFKMLDQLGLVLDSDPRTDIIKKQAQGNGTDQGNGGQFGKEDSKT